MAELSIGRRGLLTRLAAAAAVSAAAPSLGRAQEAETVEDPGAAADQRAVQVIAAAAEPLPTPEDPSFATFVDRFADAKVVLLGEQSHGTDEFYRARAALTLRLVERHGFNIVGLEADWPDTAGMDAYVRASTERIRLPSPFPRFPVWMWRNHAVLDFLDKLRALNGQITDPERRAGIYGLDLYSLSSSMDAVVSFLERHDPGAAALARERYGCLAPWAESPEAYGAQAQTGTVDTCSADVLGVISDVLQKRMAHIEASDRAYFDAIQNARVVAAAEAYYRAMYEGGAESWNLRDTHMFATLEAVLAARGPQAKAVVWAHNSHIGDASATEMGMRGEINIGQLARRRFGKEAALIGFATDRGTVTAASAWGGPAETKDVRPALPGSFGALLREAGPERFLLDFRKADPGLRSALSIARLERFIGVLYLPETERWSHYADAALSRQFDALIWLEETRAVRPLTRADAEALDAKHPFAPGT